MTPHANSHGSASRRNASRKAPVIPTRLVLIGHPVQHSVSPVFQTAALRHAGFPQEYVLLDVAPGDLARSMLELVHAKAAGNVTLPHKRAVFNLCDVTTEMARRVQAVNTFWSDGRLLYGDNTDVEGFNAGVQDVINIRKPNLRVAVLGAGGAACAVLAATAQWPSSDVIVWNRSPDRVSELLQLFDHVRQEMHLSQAVEGANLVINATSLGLHDNDPFPVDPAILGADTAVYDLVYRPHETRWVRSARARGLRAADGLGMLIEQGALAFERWFGVVPNRMVMRGAVRP